MISYFDGARRWVMAIGLVACSATCAAAIDFNTTIDGVLEDAVVSIIQGSNPNPPTVVHIVDPAYIEEDLRIYDSSVVHMSGGQMGDGVKLYDTSVMYLSGGSVEESVAAGNNSRLYISGDALLDGVFGVDTATVSISGGTAIGINAEGQSVIHITNLTFHDLSPPENGLTASASGTIFVYGSEFNYPLGPLPDSAGILSGQFAGGETFSTHFAIRDNGSIVLVPEPTSLLATLLGCVLLMARVRRN